MCHFTGSVTRTGIQLVRTVQSQIQEQNNSIQLSECNKNGSEDYRIQFVFVEISVP